MGRPTLTIGKAVKPRRKNLSGQKTSMVNEVCVDDSLGREPDTGGADVVRPNEPAASKSDNGLADLFEKTSVRDGHFHSVQCIHQINPRKDPLLC